MRRNRLQIALLAIAVWFIGFASPTASAAPTLTPAGIADGFTFSTFATLHPGATGCCGPLGVAVLSNGNIIVEDAFDGPRFVWPDVDGQTPATALFATGASSNPAFATAGGQAYGSDGAGHFVQFNTNGTVNHVLTGITTGPFLGMWGNPVNGHIIASSGLGLIDINPLANGGAGSFVVIPAPAGNGDGLTVSPDGTIVYVAQGSSINGFLIATGAQVFTASGFPSPDGAGVIVSSNALNGQIVVNNNNGVVDLLDPVTKSITPILTGGTRGDYVSPDTNNGTLFLDFSDIVGRLSCGVGCGIGSAPPPSGVPEPTTWLLLASGLAGLFAFRYRCRNQA